MRLRKLASAVWRFVLKAGTTPFGKAVEHFAVVAISSAVADLIKAYVSGNLNLNTVSAIAVGAGTAFLAAVRAYLKRAYGNR